MKKLIAVFLVLFCLSASVIADDEKKELETPTVTHVVRPPQGVRVSKNVVFLFDCSTSMSKENRFATAMRELNTVLQYPLDDGMFSLMGFKTEDSTFMSETPTCVEQILEWPGIKEDGVPNGWAKLPSLIAAKSASDFLSKIECNSWTNIGPAIQRVFHKNKNLEHITIILFSDGNNTFPDYNGKKPSEVAGLIRKLNKKREKRQKDKIQIFVFGLSVEQNTKMLSEIAKAGGGGYLTLDRICQTCLKNKGKLDVCEIQQYHRSGHDITEEEQRENLEFQREMERSLR